MNIRRLLFVAAVLIVPFTAHASDFLPRVGIEVSVASHNDRKDLKGTNIATVTQHRALQIHISGRPSAPETRMVHWTTYGRDLRSHALVPLESGEIPIDLSRGGWQVLETTEVLTTSTAAHATVSGRGRRVRVHKLDAAGVKFAGYRVEVREGSAVIGVVAEPRDLPPIRASAAR